MQISSDLADLIFRIFFCLIFVGLGGEHIVSDALIQRLMPSWVMYPRAVSIACGFWLLGWGTLILLGWHIRWAAIALGAFLIIVTVLVHLPGVMNYPSNLPASSQWMWDILQRTNLVKNLCLLGVCFHLQHHKVGKYSLENWNKPQKD